MADHTRSDGSEDATDGPMGRLVIAAGEACVLALMPFLDRDWRSVRSRDSQWSVWDTIVHVNDVLYFYAAQILLGDESDYICFELSADDHANAGRLLAALTGHARMLAAAVAFSEPDTRAHHVYGVSDPVGFTAMGVLESLVHTYDAVQGIDSTSTWRPPDDLAVPVLARLFPDIPTDVSGAPGSVLLHMCGRIPLGHLPRRADWRWYGAVPT